MKKDLKSYSQLYFKKKVIKFAIDLLGKIKNENLRIETLAILIILMVWILS